MKEKKVLLVVHPHGNYGLSSLLNLLSRVSGIDVFLHDPFNILPGLAKSFLAPDNVKVLHSDMELDESEISALELHKRKIEAFFSKSDSMDKRFNFQGLFFREKLYRLQRYYKAVKLFKELQPDFFLSYCYYIETTAYSLVAIDRGIKVISFPYAGFYMDYYRHYRLLSDYYAVSGRADYDVLVANKNISPENIITIGAEKPVFEKKEELLLLLNDNQFYPFWGQLILTALQNLPPIGIKIRVRAKRTEDLSFLRSEIRNNQIELVPEYEDLEDGLIQAKYVISIYSTAVIKALLRRCVTFMFLPVETFFVVGKVPWQLSLNHYLYEYHDSSEKTINRLIEEKFLPEFSKVILSGRSFREPDPFVDYYVNENLSPVRELEKLFGTADSTFCV